jgi:hypothetical protein
VGVPSPSHTLAPAAKAGVASWYALQTPGCQQVADPDGLGGSGCQAGSHGKRSRGQNVSQCARVSCGQAFVRYLTVIEITKRSASRQAFKPVECCLWIFCG